MPWKDAEAKKQYDKEYTKNNRKIYALSVNFSTGIPAAMDKVTAKGTSANAYILHALKEKLIKDGYLEESNPE